MQFGTVLNGLTQAGLDVPVASTGANLSYIFMTQYKAILPKQLFFAGGAATPRGDIPKLDPRSAAAKKQYYDLFAAAGLVPDNGVETVWDCTAIVVDALRHLGPKPSAEAIRNYIAHLKGYVGVSGVYDFVKEPQRGLGKDDGVDLALERREANVRGDEQPRRRADRPLGARPAIIVAGAPPPLDPTHAKAAKEPEQHENDHDHAKNAAQSRATVAAVSVVPAPSAKEKDQYDDNQNCPR